MSSDLLQQVDSDELNCPACEEQPILLIQVCSTEEVATGVQLTCPGCGFSIGGADPNQVEHAARILWDYLPEPTPSEPEYPGKNRK